MLLSQIELAADFDQGADFDRDGREDDFDNCPFSINTFGDVCRAAVPQP